MKYCQIDPENSTKEEIQAEIARLSYLMNLKKNEEQAIKIFINSVYGATASPYFVGYNVRVAEAITLQGQEMIKFVSKITNRYFNEFWHKDKVLHEILGLTDVKQVRSEVAVYGDTDSVACDSIITTDAGKMTIEDLYNSSNKNGGSTAAGHESVLTDKKILNWSEEKGLYFATPQRIIRHKVKKPKWRLKTKSGKTIEITNDHSMVVFRKGVKMVVKPVEIISGDKILCVRNSA